MNRPSSPAESVPAATSASAACLTMEDRMYSPDEFTQLRRKITSAISRRYRLRSTSANALPTPIGTSSFAAGPRVPRRLAPKIDDVEQDQAHCKDRGRRKEQGVDADRPDQVARDPRPEHRAARRAERDDGKQPLACVGGVDVVRIRPELGDHHEAEDADPEEENQPDRRFRLGEQIERRQAGDEEGGDDVDQPPARQACR